MFLLITHNEEAGMTDQEIAEHCAKIMWPDDQAARGLGMTIVAGIPNFFA